MVKKVGASSLVDQLLNGMNLPYNVEVMAMPFPPKIKILRIDIYDGPNDPVEYLVSYLSSHDVARLS